MAEPKPKLTARQAAFVEEYLVDFNATQAAIRAGYSAATAEQGGYQALRYIQVQKALGARIAARATRADVDAAYVVSRLQTIVESGDRDSDKVAALGLLARHLGMLTDRLVIDGAQQVLLVQRGDRPKLVENGAPALPPASPMPDSSPLPRADTDPGADTGPPAGTGHARPGEGPAPPPPDGT